MALSFQSKIIPSNRTATNTPSFASKIIPANSSGGSFGTKDGMLSYNLGGQPNAGPIGGAVDMVKGLVAAPATMLARPVQAAQSVGQLLGSNTQQLSDLSAQNTDLKMKLINLRRTKVANGEDTSHIDKTLQDMAKTPDYAVQELGAQGNWQPSSGGIIAPAPQNFADVKKDVGRGIETVALGLNPIAGGAAFGVGSSLEQGNDLFSVQTALQAVMGAGTGKVLEWVGKPMMDYTGKVIGVVTPTYLKGLASQGSKAVSDFMSRQELLGGAVKPLANRITSTANALEDAVNSSFKGAVTGAYPGLKTENIQQYYSDINKKDITAPAITPKAGYANATEVYNKAKAKGYDLGDVASKNGIKYDDLIENKNFNTADTAQVLRKQNSKDSQDIVAPLLKQADYSTPAVPLDKIRQGAIDSVMRDIKIADKETEIAKINNRFRSDSPGSLQDRYPNGMKLSELQQEKISHSLSTNFNNPDKNANFHIGNALGEALKVKAPTVPIPGTNEAFNLTDFNKELEKKYFLADYLDELNNKKAPVSGASKFLNLAGKFTGAGLGNEIVPGYGGFLGYHLGGLAVDTFEGMSNPVKAYYLNSIKNTQPEVYNAFRSYIKKTGQEQLLTPLLEAPKSIRVGPATVPEPKLQVIPAKRLFPVPDPKTGKMKRVFSSTI